MTRLKKQISIVIPVYNEEDGIKEFHNDILLPSVANISDYTFNIIYVDDGSSDESLSILKNFAQRDKKIKVVSLSRNFGKEIATTAGIFHASGDATIIMDSDGQHPPAIMDAFIKKWEDGAQVVVGLRTENHNEGAVKKYGSKAFYALFNLISDTKLIPRSTDYRLIDSDVRKEFIKLNEHNRIARGLIDWLGFERGYVEFSAPARLAGEASYSFSQLVKLALNSFISLTLKPLFFFGWVGLFIMLLSVIAGLFVFVEQFLLNDPLSLNFTGTAMLGIFISFMVSLTLISQAIMAVYISHIYNQSRERPLFIINKKNSVNL